MYSTQQPWSVAAGESGSARHLEAGEHVCLAPRLPPCTVTHTVELMLGPCRPDEGPTQSHGRRGSRAPTSPPCSSPSSRFPRPHAPLSLSSSCTSTSATRGIPSPTPSTPHASHTASIAHCTFSTSSLSQPRLMAPRRCHAVSRCERWATRQGRVTSERRRGSCARGSGVGGREADGGVGCEEAKGVRKVP